MGEQTSKYVNMTAAELAKTLTPAMINALDTGRNDSGTAGVLGHTNTIVALIDRGLITAGGRKCQWTDRGFRVAAFVLHGKVPARPHAVAYDGNGGVITPSVEPKPVVETDPLIGARVSVVGEHAGRGRVETMNPTTGHPYVGFDDGRRAHVHPLNVTVIDDEPAFAPGARVLTPEGETATVNAEQPAADSVEVTVIGSSNRRTYTPEQLRPAPDDEPAPGARTLVDVLNDGEQLLAKLRDEIAAAQPQPAAETDPATDDSVSDLVDRIVRRSQYLALREVLDVLDGWERGARENGDLGARPAYGEYDVWHSSDVRRMIDDAARELGVPEPSKASRKFDVGPQFRVGERVYPRSGGEVVIVERVAEIEGSGGRQQFWPQGVTLPRHSDGYRLAGPSCTCKQASDTGHDSECPRAAWARGNR